MASKAEMSRMLTILKETPALWANPITILKEAYGFELTKLEPAKHTSQESSTAVITITG